MIRNLSTRVNLSVFAAGIATYMLLALPSSAPAGGADGAEPAIAAISEKVARGRYLVTVAGCNDCHTPWTMGADGPGPDMSRMLSGHPERLDLPAPPPVIDGPWPVTVSDTNTAWSGPWGVSYTANLTPDPETGLGKWTLRDFIATIRSGRHLGRGREILPPMPIQMYKHFTDEDLAAIFSFLRTIPPVRIRVPEPSPPAGQG